MANDTTTIRLVLRNDRLSIKQKQHLSLTGRVLTLVLMYAFLVFMAVLMIFPFYWMIITSLKTGTEIQAVQQTYWPTVIYWENYSQAVSRMEFGNVIANTLIVGIISTIGTIITTILAAFAFARLEFKGRDAVFMLLLSTMMIPGEMMVNTNYITVSLFGLTGGSGGIGPYVAMIIPFMVSIFYIYLLRQNFKQVPNELYLAAKVDGKSDWAFLWKVMVPLAAPTLITICILKLMGAWNSYVWPNLVSGGEEDYYLVTNALRNTFNSLNNPDDAGAQMAATVIVTVPLLLLFIIFRKYIMRGVGRAGIKG